MNDEIKYRQLLKKYIGHVAYEEGTTFIDTYFEWMTFTEEEFQELVRIDDEIREENRNER